MKEMSEKKEGRSNNFVIQYGKNITDILTEDQFEDYDEGYSYSKILQVSSLSVLPPPLFSFASYLSSSPIRTKLFTLN
jgi:hypothetical protein